jgi:predicted anti-sigma-YlaC factor YlaD
MFITHSMTIVAIFWIAIVAMVFLTQFFSYRERASRHRMIETLAEKGQTIPPEMLTNGRDYSYRHRSPIQSGIYLMCIGVALALFFWAMGGGGNFLDGDHVPNWLPAIGIFPFMVGLARLLAAIFDRQPSK